MVKIQKLSSFKNIIIATKKYSFHLVKPSWPTGRPQTWAEMGVGGGWALRKHHLPGCLSAPAPSSSSSASAPQPRRQQRAPQLPACGPSKGLAGSLESTSQFSREHYFAPIGHLLSWPPFSHSAREIDGPWPL